MEKIRCAWCTDDPLYIAYHDHEWGRPEHDDTLLFEMLVLEGAQAGLSWITVLRKREAYRKAYEGFDPRRVARFNEAKVATMLADAGIIRNRAKIESSIRNAQGVLALQQDFGSFDAYLWRFVDGKTIRNRWQTSAQVPASTSVSDAMSKDLKKRGFGFVGTTICYAFMQATGMVDDHIVSCHCHGAREPRRAT